MLTQKVIFSSKTCFFYQQPYIHQTSQELRKAALRVVGCQGVKVLNRPGVAGAVL